MTTVKVRATNITVGISGIILDCKLNLRSFSVFWTNKLTSFFVRGWIKQDFGVSEYKRYKDNVRNKTKSKRF